ncbi:sigma-70 family RNA polymerase sigma factor [Hymenobacter terrigena]
MPSSDATLWNRFLAGEEQAFEAMFQGHYRELYGYGLRLTSDEDLTKDCIQNLFQRLWQRRQHLSTVEEIKPYLFKSMRHEVAAEIKAQQRRSLLESTYPVEFEIQYSPEDFLIAQQLTAEQHTQLLAALGRLSNRQREAIYLKFFDGFDYERISEIMGLNQQSIRNLVYQGIKLLRQSLTLPLLLLLLSGQLAAAFKGLLKINL